MDTFKSLRFISCIRLEHETLVFKELTNIYDAWIWVCLMCDRILLTATISYLGRRGSFSRNVLAVFKVVVGQGDPFMRRVLNSAPLRFTAVAYLFVGTILNEGYKNENMYHIISSPRKIIMQDKISQLLQSKFTVFTRASTIQFSLDHEGANPELEFADHDNHNI